MKKLFDQGCQAIADRSQWEAKQRLYYEMRHDGLRRRNKPWPGAADLHFPLVDMNIRKTKPFWESQATATERLASFVSLQEQQQETTGAAADFFDFELKQHTEFETELIRAVDCMLLRGRGVLKVTTDPFDDHNIVCASIDLPFIIMMDGAEDFADADGWIEVKHLTLAGYRRDRRYSQDEATIGAIKGSKDLDISTGVFQDKEVREGVNYSRNSDQIILWEHWVKTMGGWTVYTYSPQSPDKEIRKPFGCPYKLGGKASCPYFSFKMEIKDRGWYAPRGIAELTAAFERYASKLWNEKTDAMTFANRPVFTSDQQIQNTGNIRWVPGEFIPGNIKGVQMPTPAFSFDQEIAFARSTAEQVTMMPDFGIERPGQPGQAGGQRTATENNRISTLQNVGTESNGRIFRRDLSKAYRHIWGLILQFKRKKLSYFVSGELKTLPEAALHDAYLIMPDGAPDQWNKQMRQQRADARLQKFAGSPNVNQDELVYDSLAADDPMVAQKLFVPGNLKAGSEAEDEAVEISIMKDGFPAQVKPNEDHATRIHVLLGWLQKQSMTGAPVDPVAQQRVQQHLALHWQYLKKIQPEAARALLQQIQQGEQGQRQVPGAGGQVSGQDQGQTEMENAA